MGAAGEDGNEWATTLYGDGEKYYFTELTTDGLNNHVKFPSAPSGFTTEGYVHNHPKCVNPWPSGVNDMGVFSDEGFAHMKGKPVWNISSDGYVYRYDPNAQYRTGTSRWDSNEPGGIPGFNGKLR